MKGTIREPLKKPSHPIAYANEWHRRKEPIWEEKEGPTEGEKGLSRKPTKRELLARIHAAREEIYIEKIKENSRPLVAKDLASLEEENKKKKGESVSHEEKEGRRGYEHRGNSRTGSGSGCRTSSEKKRGEISENVRETNSRGEDKDVSYDKERRIEDSDRGANTNKHDGCGGTDSRSADGDRRDGGGTIVQSTQKKRTVIDEINECVSEMVDREPQVYGLIHIKVRGLIRDRINSHAILATIKEILEWKIVHWKFRFDVILAKHLKNEEQLARNAAKVKEECLRRTTEYNELEKQKQNQTGRIDLMGMTKAFLGGLKLDVGMVQQFAS